MSTTQHPLTETAAALLWNAHRTHNALPFHEQGRLYMQSQTAMLRAAFDAGREHERTTPEDDHPWEPLNGRAPRVGEEIRRDRYGITSIAVVGRVDRTGDPWTAEGALIGMLKHGTWYVRRTVQELPTEPGAVIVPADGHEAITATLGSETYHAREAILFSADAWLGAWRDTAGARAYMGPTRITPGTWQVDDQ